MKKFAFLVHPRKSHREDMRKVWRPFGLIPECWLSWLMTWLPPIVRGRVSLPGSDEIVGWIIVVPLTGRQFLELPRAFVFKKVLQACRKAENLGAEVVGLGQLTSSVTNGGADLVEHLDIGVTNGNALTAAITVRALERICLMRGLDKPLVSVVGATGSVGSAISQILSRRELPLLLVARNRVRLEALADTCTGGEVKVATRISDIKVADVVVVTTSSAKDLIKAEYLKEGAVVYDNTQPRNTSRDILVSRPDVLVVDGGVISIPGVNLRLNIGLKPEQGYACLVETMLLALEGMSDHYSIGNATPDQAKEMLDLLDKYKKVYGFELAAFSSFGKTFNLPSPNGKGIKFFEEVIHAI